MEAVQKTPEREAFYRKIDGDNLSALWNVLGDLVTPEPRSACRPHLWKFDSIRDYMNGRSNSAAISVRVQSVRRASACSKLRVTDLIVEGLCRVIGGSLASRLFGTHVTGPMGTAPHAVKRLL